jgi:hypothetical protein
MAAIAETNCAWGHYAAAMADVSKDKTKAKTEGLPAREALIANASTMILQLQQTLTNVGGESSLSAVRYVFVTCTSRR